MDETLNLLYDGKADLLYVSWGSPREAVSHETEIPGVIARRDPDSDEVVGVTVVNFAKRWGANSLPISFPFRPVTQAERRPA